MSTITIKAAELTGAALDWAVAVAEGKDYSTNKDWGNALVNDLGRCSIAHRDWNGAKYFDPCVDELAPCDIFLGVGGIDEDAAEDAADTLFGNMTSDIAASMVQKQIEQIQLMFCGTDHGESDV